MGRFEGQAGIITGAAGAIGSAVVELLAGEGMDLCLADRADTGALAARVVAIGRRVIEHPLEVTDAGSVEAMVTKTMAAFGKVDLLVTVAGVVSLGSVESLAEAEWDRVIGINLKGVFLSCKAVIAPMRAQRSGRIVNIGSVIGKNGGNPRPWIDREEQKRGGNAAYGAAKAGVHALTWYLAKELAGDGIMVNCVAPGPIATGMTVGFPAQLKALIPVGRMGTPRDVAQAVAFLASPATGFITGEILDVNGGILMD